MLHVHVGDDHDHDPDLDIYDNDLAIVFTVVPTSPDACITSGQQTITRTDGYISGSSLDQHGMILETDHPCTFTFAIQFGQRLNLTLLDFTPRNHTGGATGGSAMGGLVGELPGAVAGAGPGVLVHHAAGSSSSIQDGDQQGDHSLGNDFNL